MTKTAKKPVKGKKTLLKKKKAAGKAGGGYSVISLPLSEIKENPDNPRLIRDEKFKKLVKSLKDFPEMMNLRPVVVNADMVILGGNMRYRAAKEAGWNEMPVIIADNLTPEQEKEFIIKDNVSGGDWDWDILANEWDAVQLEDWGVDVPDMDSGDIVELDKITTTYNINIKCETPDECDEIRQKLGITSNSISASMIMGLLA